MFYLASSPFRSRENLYYLYSRQRKIQIKISCYNSSEFSLHFLCLAIHLEVTDVHKITELYSVNEEVVHYSHYKLPITQNRIDVSKITKESGRYPK